MELFPTTILLGTDGSANAELAATTAIGLARVTGSRLHIVHVGPVVPEDFEPTDVEPARMERDARNLLDEQTAKVRGLGGEIAGAHLRMGGAAEELLELAEELDVGLIVVSNRGRGRIRRAVMGSVSDEVVRRARCPVLVVRGKPTMFPARVLLASDGSEGAAHAAEVAADLTLGTGSTLHLITVGEGYPYYELPDSPAVFEEIVEAQRQEARKVLEGQTRTLKEFGIEVADTHLGAGRPDEEILLLAEDLGTDLLVMGSRGLNPAKRALMGSVSDSVVRHAHCPVLVVRRHDSE